MPFQQTVGFQYGAGIPGELSHEAPLRAQPLILASTAPANNIIGSVALFHTAVAGQAAVDSTVGVGAFAGILSSPKEHVSFGTAAGGSLAPSMVLPNGVVATGVQEGMMFVVLQTAAAVGDWIYAANATGLLSTTAPDATAPANSRRVPGYVTRYPVVTAPGLAMIHLDAPA